MAQPAAGLVQDAATFGDAFLLESFLGKLAKPVLDPSGERPQRVDTSTAAAAAHASLEKARGLLEVYDRAEADVLQLYKQVSKNVETVHIGLAAQEAKHQNAVASASSNVEKVKETFRDLEERSNKISQTSTRIGTRLQSADNLRMRALELVSLLQYLQLFSKLPDREVDYAKTLPALFWDEKKLSDAAAVARKLLALISDAETAQQRSRLIGVDEEATRGSGGLSGPNNELEPAPQSSSTPSAAQTAAWGKRMPGQGSLEYCARRLATYCSWLQERVVGRFDAAVAVDDFKTMAGCARTMVLFDRESIIIKRYISFLPVFQSSLDEVVWVHSPAVSSDAAAVQARLRPLARLYSTLGETFEIEVSRIRAIFPNPHTALQMLAAQMFEDRATMALSRLLEATAEDAFESSDPDSDLEDSARSSPSRGSPSRGSPSRAVSLKRSAVTARSQPQLLQSQSRLAQRLGDRDYYSDGGSSGGPSVLALELHLRLLAAAYARTQDLAAQVEAASGGQVEAGGYVEGAFVELLRHYPAPELQWLDSMAERTVAPQPGGEGDEDPHGRPPLTLELADGLLARNAEALQRCLLFRAGERAPPAVRLLFVGEFANDVPGSLLDHLPGYLVNGLQRAMDISEAKDSAPPPAACNVFRVPPHMMPPRPVQPGGKGAPPPPPPPPLPPPITRAGASQAAQLFTTVRILPMLQAVSCAATVVTRLQVHYTKVVLPALAGSPADLGACSGGLAEAVRAVEETALGVLRRMVDLFVIQCEKTMMYEQRRAEFMPAGDVSAAVFARPTDACLLVTALFEAFGKAVRDHLEDNNMTSLLHEAGARMHATFLNHMQQYTYNAAGALRWRNDVAAYAEALHGWGVPDLDSRMAALGALVGVLVVEPEQLLPLVNGTLRIDHREAIKFIRLREDFHLARVQGSSLQQLFGAEEALVAASAAAAGGAAGGAARR